MPDKQEDAIQRLYKYRPLTGDGREFTRQIIVDRELYYPSPNELNDPCDLRFKVSMDGARQDNSLRGTPEEHCAYVQQWLNNGAYKNIRIFSFSEASNIELMWIRYAENLSGVCLEFQVPLDLELHDVKYPDSRPVFYFADLDEATHDAQRFRDSIIATLTTKTDDWKYEREWRCIVFDGVNKRPLSRITLSGVVFGCRTSDKDRDDVLNWLDEGNHDVALYECQMNADKPGLVVVPIDAGQTGNNAGGNCRSLRSLTEHSIPPIIHEVPRSSSLPEPSDLRPNAMIRIHKKIESETITIPELKSLMGKDVEITVRVKPTADESQKESRSLHGSVLKYDRPVDPVAEADWEVLG